MGALTLKTSTIRARVCDACRSNPSTIFCEADSAYLCTGCDSHVHAGNKLSLRHKRVWVCEACEQAPAAFICKADAASLCTTCDAVIHSANPLSQRHHRVPVMPFSGSIGQEGKVDNYYEDEDEDEDEAAASWLIFDSPVNNSQDYQNEYLDLVDYNSWLDTQFSNDMKFDGTNIIQQQSYGGNCDVDSVVPVHCLEVKKHYQFPHDHHFQNQKLQFGVEYESSNGGYRFPASHGQSLSISSVPDSSTTEVSISNARTQKGPLDLFSSPSTQMTTQLTPMDRESRVLRYREKKKTRKFEKTIRYASRKAYAETRPRIKGRFAKGTNGDIEVDQMFSTTLITEDGCFFHPTF